jgi:hypothetical protein
MNVRTWSELPTGSHDSLALNPGTSESSAAAFRAQTAPCAACHTEIDAYGLLLDNFDWIGRYRALDAAGRPIQNTIVLPTKLGGKTVHSAAELGTELAASGRFTACLAKNLLPFALAEPIQLAEADCDVERASAETARNGDDFSELIRQLILSNSFSVRAGEKP